MRFRALGYPVVGSVTRILFSLSVGVTKDLSLQGYHESSSWLIGAIYVAADADCNTATKWAIFRDPPEPGTAAVLVTGPSGLSIIRQRSAIGHSASCAPDPSPRQSCDRGASACHVFLAVADAQDRRLVEGAVDGRGPRSSQLGHALGDRFQLADRLLAKQQRPAGAERHDHQQCAKNTRARRSAVPAGGASARRRRSARTTGRKIPAVAQRRRELLGEVAPNGREGRQHDEAGDHPCRAHHKCRGRPRAMRQHHQEEAGYRSAERLSDLHSRPMASMTNSVDNFPGIVTRNSSVLNRRLKAAITP